VTTILLFTIFVFYGCDLFKTRDPETPERTTSTYKPPVTPDLVLDNLISSIEESNVDNYMRNFIDTTVTALRYSFNPSAGYEIRLQEWGLENERRYFQNLSAQVSGVPSLTLSSRNEQNRTANTTEYTAYYFLIYPHKLSSIATQVRGFLHFYLSMDSQQRWGIYRWDDVKTTTDSTWSYLKFSFSS
jgi:hypothetical protein